MIEHILGKNKGTVACKNYGFLATARRIAGKPGHHRKYHHQSLEHASHPINVVEYCFRHKCVLFSIAMVSFLRVRLSGVGAWLSYFEEMQST